MLIFAASREFDMETNRFTFDKLHAAGSPLDLTPAMAIDLQDELKARKEALATDTAVLQSLLDTQNHKKAAEAYAIEKKDSGKITVALSSESHRCNSSTACGQPSGHRPQALTTDPRKARTDSGSTVVHPSPHPHRVLDARRCRAS